MSLLVHLDNIFALRAWGLVLNGVLPSNFALLGIVSVSKQEYVGGDALLALALLPPIVVTRLLIHQRQAAWYLSRDWLKTRATFVTLLILLIAMGIAGMAGIASAGSSQASSRRPATAPFRQTR